MASLAEDLRKEYEAFQQKYEKALNTAQEFADYADFLEKTLIKCTGMTKTEIFKLWCRERAEA